MDTSNHSSKTHRVYWLTRPGQRLAAYLDYCDTQPEMSADIAFADVPEQFDLDRNPPERPCEEDADLTGDPNFEQGREDAEQFDHEDDMDDDEDDYGDHSPEGE